MCLNRLGLRKGQTVYVTGNIGMMGHPLDANDQPIKDKNEIAKFYLNAIEDVVGSSGTVVFPTHSWPEVSNKAAFCLKTTKSDYFLSEYIRLNRSSRRQWNPFASVSAYGELSREIISEKIARHVYGHGSPTAKLAEFEAIHLSIGLSSNLTISAVHHCEFLSGVPYRYMKSFTKYCTFGKIKGQFEFFLHVLYNKPDLEITRDKNQKIFTSSRIHSNHKELRLGRAIISSIPINIFVDETVKLMQSDPYIWTASINGDQPWLS